MSNIKEQQEKSKKNTTPPGKMLTPGGEQKFAAFIYAKF